MSFIMAGIAVGGAILNFMSASDAAKAQAIIAKANAEAANLTRKADNEFRGASAALQNYIRAEDNKKKFEAAGDQWNVINQNIGRINDQYIRGTVQQKLSAAEEIGQISATASFMGIGGSTVDTINSLVERNYTDQGINQKENMDYQINDMFNERNSLMAQASSSTDQGTTFGNLDYNINVPEYVAKPSIFTYLLSGMQSDAFQKSVKIGLGEIQMKRIKDANFNQGAKNQSAGYGVNLNI